MNHSPADILLQELIDSGLVDTTGTDEPSWEGRVNRVVDEPDYLVVVNDTQGVEQHREMFGDTIVFAGVQIRIRSDDYLSAFRKSHAIQAHLDTIAQSSVSIDSDNYEIHAVHRVGNVIPLGKSDDDQREHFVLNATLYVKEL